MSLSATLSVVRFVVCGLYRCASVPLCLCCCVCLRLWLLTVAERRTFTSCCPPYLPPFFVSQQFRFFFLVLQKYFCFDCCFFSNRALASFPLQQSRNEYVCAKMCWWRSKLFLVAAFLKRAHIIFTANKGGHFDFFISRFLLFVNDKIKACRWGCRQQQLIEYSEYW